MNHSHHLLGNGTARIVFTSDSTSDARSKNDIGRVYLDKWGEVDLQKGITLHQHPGGQVAHLIDVLPLDFVIISERGTEASVEKWTCFRIGESFEPHAFEWPGSNDLKEISRLIEVTHTAPIHRIDRLDDWLRAWDFNSCPDWLEISFSTLLASWRASSPDQLSLNFPELATDFEIAKYTSETPYMALRFLKHRLSDDQIKACIKASPHGAIMYAFSHMTRRQIKSAAEKCPEVLLNYAATELSPGILRLCASEDPGMAFDIRSRMPPRIRATLLSSSLVVHACIEDPRSNSAIHGEIIESFIEYPKEWLACHEKNFGLLRGRLLDFVDLNVDGPMIQMFLEKFSSENRGMLFAYLASTM
jgi:hypothetical protein